MEELRSVLLDLQLRLNSIINRIPEPTIYYGSPDGSFSQSPVEIRSSDTELPGKGPSGCLEQYHTPVLVSFHKWARILLSLFIDKVGFEASVMYLNREVDSTRHSVLPTNLFSRMRRVGYGRLPGKGIVR